MTLDRPPPPINSFISLPTMKNKPENDQSRQTFATVKRLRSNVRIKICSPVKLEHLHNQTRVKQVQLEAF